MKLTNKSGFTMTEVLISTVIFSFIMAGLLSVLLAGNASWTTNNAAVTAQREARKAITYMTSDMRVVSGASVSQTSDDVTLIFTHPNDGTVTYSWSTSGSDANRIIRTTSSAAKIVAQSITAFAVTDSTNDITIDLISTTQNNQGQLQPFQLVKKIAKR